MWRAFSAALLLIAWGSLALGGAARGPIVILSDADFTPENGVVGGSGSPDDPFVIAGWRIEGVGMQFGIVIRGTTLPFVIRDVEVCGAATAGIKLEAVRNGRVEDVTVSGSSAGIMISFSHDLWIRDTSIRECDDGVRALFSERIHFEGLSIEECLVGIWFSGVRNSELLSSLIRADLGILAEMGSEGNVFARNGLFCRIPARSEGGNSWDDGERGNFWQGLTGPDADGDGIVDVPYPVSSTESDRFPLTAWPQPSG